MTNQNLLCCILLSMLSFNLSAQDYEFHWGAGVGIHQIGDQWAAGVNVSPRLNLFELSESASFSIGTKASFLYMSQAEGSMELPETTIGFEAPVMAMVNIGRASSYSAIEQMGFMVGAGYNFGQMTLSGDGYETVLKTSGPTVMGGIRFQVMGNRTMGVNVSQTFGRGTNKESLNSLSIRVLYYFGEY